ncbi:MAG: ScpA family protein [Candidatus Dormibacteria bacterium]
MSGDEPWSPASRPGGPLPDAGPWYRRQCGELTAAENGWEHGSQGLADGPEDGPQDGPMEVTGRREPGLEATAAGGPDTHEMDSPSSEAERFIVDIPGYRGSLAGLVARAQRGDIDLTAVPVHQLTSRYRRALAEADPAIEPREIADFLGLAARLLSLKAQRVIPDGPLDTVDEDAGTPDDPADLPGRRLAEYRLFREAADALLSEAAEEGARSFLGLVAPEVLPVERLAIAPERLAAALRAVLLRIDARAEVLGGLPTFSVEDKLAGVRALLADHGRMSFEELFAGVGSRMEAVAVFLALLELLRQGGARVEQLEPFGPITVSGLG